MMFLTSDSERSGDDDDDDDEPREREAVVVQDSRGHDDRDSNQHTSSSSTSDARVDSAPVRLEAVVCDREGGGDDDGEDLQDDGAEMSPLLMGPAEEDGDGDPAALMALAPSSPGTTTQILSRRKNPVSLTDNDYCGKGGLSCLRKKMSRRSDDSRNNGLVGEAPPDESLISENSTDARPGGEGVGGFGGASANSAGCVRVRRGCRDSVSRVVRTTVSVMNLLARILLWGSFFATTVGVVWYSRELRLNGTDPHLIAWFSAGAFVLLGFPISMYGIFMHLTNYYQPNVQCYVVRILWMVPIYSVESWLCLRFHTLAIYIETLRDCYESYVLYSFLQYLIMVLGGEEALVLMLKDKSPTRGVHMAPLNWFVSPWLMGQPIRVSSPTDGKRGTGGGFGGGVVNHGPVTGFGDRSDGGRGGQSSGGTGVMSTALGGTSVPGVRPVKKVRWTSPFFVRCKFGVLQYVLLKFVSSIFVMLLEIYGLYKEGDFTPRGGYLYICILTNLSQCWALYCLVFFYYATKNELGPIRPVGKFFSVKAVVFFTWWQSLGISILFQMGMIPHYAAVDDGREWTSEAVAKGLQDYLICIEMFVAAIVHTFVFPHTDYLEPLVDGSGCKHHRHAGYGARRLGRKGRPLDAALMYQYHRRGDEKSSCSKSSGSGPTDHNLELGTLSEAPLGSRDRAGRMIDNGRGGGMLEDDIIDNSDRSRSPRRRPQLRGGLAFEHSDSVANPVDTEHRHIKHYHERQGFVRALLDSTVPRDVFDETVGIVKGDFHVEKKTLLHHAATSDEYDLFSKSSKRRRATEKQAAARAAKASSAGGTGNRRLGAEKSNRGGVVKSSFTGAAKDAID